MCASTVFWKKPPEHTDNAEILYQLAKSYDLQGQVDESLMEKPLKLGSLVFDFEVTYETQF